VWHCAEVTTQSEESISNQIDKSIESISNLVFNDGGKDDEVLIKIGDNHLERRALRCLKPETWLNDEVMDAYMELLNLRNADIHGNVMFFLTHFYRSITRPPTGYNFKKGLPYVRGRKLFHMDLLVIPMNQGGIHWVMVVINIKEKRIEFYDPLPQKSTNSREMSIMQQWFAQLVTQELHLDTIDIRHWGSQTMTNIPTQPDNYNCGVYVLHFAEFLGRGVPLVIDPKNLVDLRNQILLDLYTKSINRG
jgi:sentrin-specific protease 1